MVSRRSLRRRLPLTLAAASLATAGVVALEGRASACGPQRVGGLIATRYNHLGGNTGPLGCPISEEVNHPEGSGRVQHFEHGDIAMTNDANNRAPMVLSAVLTGGNLAIESEVTGHYSYGFFLARWDKDGKNLGQRDVTGTKTSEQTSIPTAGGGRYRVVVKGCDGSVAHSSCKQDWSLPVYVTVPAPPAPAAAQPPPMNRKCSIAAGGEIAKKWYSLKASDGVLGCPVSGEANHPAGGGARIQRFDHGEIVWDDQHGALAGWIEGNQMVADWGPTEGFTYDVFNVRYDKDGKNVGQDEAHTAKNGGHWTHVADQSGTYTVNFEGCDRSGGKSTCRQGFSKPVTLKYDPPQPDYTPLPVARKRPVPAGRTCGGRPSLSGSFQREWMRLGGPSGAMGCPKGTPRSQPGDSATAAGSVVDFDNGQIAVSTEGGDERVIAALQAGNGILVDWTETFGTPHFTYDKFMVRWDANGKHSDKDQIDIMEDIGKDQTIAVNFTRTWPLDNGNSLQLRETHLRSKGSQWIPADQLAGDYRITVKGCDVVSKTTVDHESTCRQSWFQPVHVNVQLKRDPNNANAWVAADGVMGPFFPDLDLGAPSTSVDDAKARMDDRAAAAIAAEACGVLANHNYNNEMGYAAAVLAKFAYADYFNSDRCPGRDVNNRDEAAASLLEQFVASGTGTTIDSGGVLKLGLRVGEYDSALIGFLPMLYRYHRVMPQKVFDHVLFNLLSKKGKQDPADHVIHGVLAETENHILMIESSRYLSNQLLFLRTNDPQYDNAANGNDAWMLNHLSQFLRTDFLEYNSKPYQNYSIAALQNLASYANDKNPGSHKVRVAARMVLDYISTKVAVSTNDSRRSVPFRRRVSHDVDNFFDMEADSNTPRSLLYAGTTDALFAHGHAIGNFSYEMTMAALSEYRVPDLLLDLMVNRDHRRFVQAFSHYSNELYAGSPSYLLSAGGLYATYAYEIAKVALLGAGDDIGLAVPTMLLPSGHQSSGPDGAFASRADLIRFLGASDNPKRSNMCVAQDFACGLTPQLPKSYATGRPAACFASADERGTKVATGVVDSGPWRFFSESGACAREPNSKYGYYVAMFMNSEFGFIEAFDTAVQKNVTFQQFIDGVLKKNAQTKFTSGTNTYVKTSGEKIQFKVNPDSAVIQAPGQPTWNATATGTIMNSVGKTGKITVENPALRRKLILDYSNAQNPVRTEQ